MTEKLECMVTRYNNALKASRPTDDEYEEAFAVLMRGVVDAITELRNEVDRQCQATAEILIGIEHRFCELDAAGIKAVNDVESEPFVDALCREYVRRLQAGGVSNCHGWDEVYRSVVGKHYLDSDAVHAAMLARAKKIPENQRFMVTYEGEKQFFIQPIGSSTSICRCWTQTDADRIAALLNGDNK